MRVREILGFEQKEDNLLDSVCPHCGWELNIPLRVVRDGWLRYDTWDEYTCSKCGLKWRFKN